MKSETKIDFTMTGYILVLIRKFFYNNSYNFHAKKILKKKKENFCYLLKKYISTCSLVVHTIGQNMLFDINIFIKISANGGIKYM